MSDMNVSMSGLAMLLQGLPGAGVPNELASPQLPGASPAEGGFSDILGLVEDMEIADHQGGAKEDVLASATALKFNETEGFNVARNESALAAVLSPISLKDPSAATAITQQPKVSENMTVGRESQKILDTVETGAWAPEFGLRNAMAQQSLGAKMSLGAPSGEAVAQWSAALASGDLKSVELGGGEPLLTRVGSAERLIASTGVAAPIAPVAAWTSREHLAATRPDAVLPETNEKPAIDSRRNVTLGSQELDIAREAETPVSAKSSSRITEASVRGEMPSREVVEQADVPTKSAGARTSSSSEAPTEPKVISERAEKIVTKPKVRDASEFLLERSEVGTEGAVRSDMLAHARTPALAGAATLGESTSDGRISPDSVKFVSERIDQLKAQGGGTIKIELNPQQMGSIEVRVSMSRNQVRVQMSAERPETLRALEASKGELLSRIGEGAQAAQIEFAAKVASVVRHDSALRGQTDSFLDIRDLTGNRRASDMQVGTMGAGNPSQDSPDSGRENSFGRDERREAARDQWEGLFRERKSA